MHTNDNTIRHIVIINFRIEEKENAISGMNKTRSLVAKIPGIISYSIFENISQYTDKDHFSVGVEILFEDKEALEVFMKDEKHYEANALFESYLSTPAYMVLTHKVGKEL
jgi:quinol monooxygenase YgiN